MPSAPRREIHRFNGVDLYFEVRGEGEPLLLLHGFTGCSQDWAPFVKGWEDEFCLVTPDLRGHGRSSSLIGPFRHRDAAADIAALLDYLEIGSCRGLGLSVGGNVLLHLAVQQPERVVAAVLVSATPRFPDQARSLMRSYPDSLIETEREALRARHAGGEGQIRGLMDAACAFADSRDDMDLTPADLAKIQARTLIVQGDSDPLYPVDLSIEMAENIPSADLWILPEGGHLPVFGDNWSLFAQTSLAFLRP